MVKSPFTNNKIDEHELSRRLVVLKDCVDYYINEYDIDNNEQLFNEIGLFYDEND